MESLALCTRPQTAVPDNWIRLAALLLMVGVVGCSSETKAGAGMGGAGGQTEVGTGGTVLVGIGGNGGTGGGGGGAGGAAGAGGCSGARPTGGCVGAANGVCYPDPIPHICGSDGGWTCPSGTFPREECTCSGTPRSFVCPPDAGDNGDAAGDASTADTNDR